MKYIRITRRIFGMLELRMREGALMILLLGLYAALEGFGIGLLLPVMQFLETGGQVTPSGSVWPLLIKASSALGVPLNLGVLLAAAFIPILLRQGVYFLTTWYDAGVQSRAVARLTVRAFRTVAHADLAYIESQDLGHLLGFVAGQTGRCGQALMQYIKLLSAALIIAIYAALLAVISWQLALIAMVALLGVSVGVRRILVGSRKYGEQLTRASLNVTSAVRERLGALRLVKMRAREDEEAAHVEVLAQTLRGATVRIAIAAARVEVLVDPALMLAVFVIVYVGVTVYGLTLASLGVFMFILLRLNTKAKEINLGRQQLASQMPSFDYVESTLAASLAAQTPPGGQREFLGLEDSVVFDDVWFAYSGADTQVLRGVALRIPKGSMTAIVGRSGAGKSTMADMIPLLRRPTGGRVLIDGIPSEEYDLVSLRTRIGLLTQEPILFNDTIYRNLIYGLEDVPADGEVRAALDASYCSEFVDALPDGLQTRIGDRGTRFSGGQRQRLALARVLLQDPDILILDEPTSALDSESEEYIRRALERVAAERTVVVIAHRLATVERADRIVVLHEGVIVEEGTHAELLETDGHYKRLFETQIHT